MIHPFRGASALKAGFSILAGSGAVDAFIVATEDGFSPHGKARAFFASDLGISEQEIVDRANWNYAVNERVTLIALASRRRGSLLKGVILAPGESSRCYRQYWQTAGARPYRDFYYNVTYEAIAYASRMWGARRLGISHLSASGNFHEHIATCQAEALLHFCDQAAAPVIDSLTFVGCCIEPRHLDGIKHFRPEPEHRPIQTETWIHLSWV